MYRDHTNKLLTFIQIYNIYTYFYLHVCRIAQEKTLNSYNVEPYRIFVGDLILYVLSFKEFK